MVKLLAALPIVLAACGPETTSFRTTDRSDPAESTGAAFYQLRVGERGAATVHVWSNGGYIGTSDEPMTHVGFDIRNTGSRPIVFDEDALQLVVTGKSGVPLPATKFVTVTPLGPAQVTIAPGASSLLDAYYQLGVRPRTVEAMRVRWSIHAGADTAEQITSFVRDDDYPVIDYRPAIERAPS